MRFVVHGQAAQASTAIRLSAARGAGSRHTMEARPGEHIIALQVDNGPRLLLHPQNAADLLTAQQGAAASKAMVEVPAQLAWPGIEAASTARAAQRGWLGRAVLQSLEVLLAPADPALTLATAAVTRRADLQQAKAGLHALQPADLRATQGRPLRRLPPSKTPQLVLLHGSFVNTAATFGALWQRHAPRVSRLFDHYRGDVYAFDHPTLRSSPIANALALARALPDGARLHLLAHSRGGLVAELLARACADVGFDDASLAGFTGPHATQADEMRRLARAVRGRGIRIERIVRVACPVRGTLLASRRLDAYLSVLQWLLTAAGVPVLPALAALLQEVARRRADPAELPGLEAMMPGHPLVAWLNRAEAPLPGDLRVIAGDIEGDSVTSWLKTLMADAFYWTDNDLVVQTRSMYGGAPRHAAPLFLLDRGGTVQHFRYFANDRTAQAACDALVADAPPGFLPIGPLSAAGEEAGGTRSVATAAAAAATAAPGPAVSTSAGPTSAAPPAQPDRPAVVLLPGLLGTHLAVQGRRVWFGWRLVNGLQPLAWLQPGVQPQAPLECCYGALITHLSATHEVIAFGYDWRAPLEDEARRLARTLESALDARQASQQPVRLIAHSMGGLLARTLALVAPATWERLMAHPDTRLLMLGTPQQGSWAPMQALSGDDGLTEAVMFGGPLLDGPAGRQALAGLPGLLQMQAGLLDPAAPLGKAATWRQLAEQDLAALARHCTWHGDPLQLAPHRWGLPPQPVLDRAVALRRRLDEQALPLQKLRIVLGRDRCTPAGYRVDAQQGVVYLLAEEAGDGRVTQANAMLAGVAAWQADVSHALLAQHADAFEAYAELLASGHTERLPPVPALSAQPAGDAPAAHRLSRSGTAAVVPAPNLPSLFDMGAAAVPAALPVTTPALKVSVRNADVRSVREPLMLGHYRAATLTGTEAAIDSLLHGAMQQALRAGLYAGAVGTHQLFAGALAAPATVVVVGLGEEGKLRVGALQDAVRHATLAFAQRMAEQQGGSSLALAATLLGSGGSGISAGHAAQAMAQGVREANAHLLDAGWPLVSQLILVELYLDRATEAWMALDGLCDAAPATLQLASAIEPGPGALRRPLESGYRGTRYDFISALGRPEAKGGLHIDYTLDTRRARSEVRGQSAQATLVHDLVAAAADERPLRPNLGRSLFRLLVPMELEPFLSGSRELVLELDERTAAIPWELLEPESSTAQAPPWAVRCKLLRKLRTTEFREQPHDADAAAAALVIGEPAVQAAEFAPLPGARAEAQAVAATLGTQALLGAGAAQVVEAVLGASYRIVHVAGHGMYAADGSGGVVLSDGAVLGAREIERMHGVPELVFINCCHLGKIESPIARQRSEFAANVAEQLIRIGVRCVMAAGWAVDDAPAQHFATRFYEALLHGSRFVDAAALAREATWSGYPRSRTWAAYQCWGDPDWRLHLPADGKAGTAPERRAPIASAPALALALETLAIQAEFDGSTLTVPSHVIMCRFVAGHYSEQGT